MSKSEIISRLNYLEKVLPLVIQKEKDTAGMPIIPASRIPHSALIRREINSLRMMLAD